MISDIMSSIFLETPYSLYPWICRSRHPLNIGWMTIPEPSDGMQRKIETSVFLKILMGSWWGMGWVCIVQSCSTKERLKVSTACPIVMKDVSRAPLLEESFCLVYSLRWSWNHGPFSGWAVWGWKGWVCVCFLSLSPPLWYAQVVKH